MVSFLTKWGHHVRARSVNSFGGMRPVCAKIDAIFDIRDTAFFASSLAAIQPHFFFMWMELKVVLE